MLKYVTDETVVMYDASLLQTSTLLVSPSFLSIHSAKHIVYMNEHLLTRGVAIYRDILVCICLQTVKGGIRNAADLFI